MKTAIVMLGVVAGAMVSFTAIKIIPIYISYSFFTEDLRVHARMISVRGNSSSQLRNAFLRDAQHHNIPLRSENLRFEIDPTGRRFSKVTADYDVPLDLYFFQPTLHLRSQYPEDKEAGARRWRYILSTVGLLLGLFWFFKGWVIFYGYRVIADTPSTPIRGVAMGLVQIRGRAVGENTLVSPVSKTPCFLYRVSVEQWTGDRSGIWSPYLIDTGWVRFYLEDETGKVLIDPRDAKYELQHSARVHVSKSPVAPLGHAGDFGDRPSNLPGMAASSEELRSYVLRAASGMRTALYQGADLSNSLAVGSQQEKPQHVRGPLVMLLGLFLFRRASLLGADSSYSSGDYRLTEHCVVPDTLYDVVGTCLENRNAPDELGRQVIAKGENAPTFLISQRSGADLEETLRSRAFRYVLGGGALAVGCAAALLEGLGYF